MRVVLSLLMLVWLILPAAAVEPSEMLKDPVLEARARVISAELRCLVCKNQSIDGSNAQLAKDLRILVRERLVQGETNEQVINYVVSRYGDFVLLNPPFKSYTYALWYGPPVFIIFGIFVVIMIFRRNRRPASPAIGLSDEEHQRLESLLDDDGVNEVRDTHRNNDGANS